jgi:protocatechuate 3,4-dioxygenase beta subunit
MHSIDRGSRRRFVAGLVTTGIAGLSLPTLGGGARAQSAEPTTACEDGDEATPQQTEGPYFSPNSPQRAVLREAGMAGTPITLRGFVLTRSCQPVGAALVDLWHANDAGEYDNVGFRLRGHQFTAADGSYAFETIVPGIYPGRTRHFHLKFQAPNEPVLTTQFYFPGEPENERDGIFDPALLLQIDGSVARFDTILDIA